ncbi:MAG: RDD family protein [Nitrosomonas sp.]|nr:RDD family protein [Nitrosomonas sp.]
MVYDFLLLLAIWFVASLIFIVIVQDTSFTYFRPIYQFYSLSIIGIYFIWFWTHGGQTLAMQTWKIRVVSKDGKALTIKQAISRYLFAVIGITSFGFGIIWALFDRDRQFLHDRLAGTRIVKVEY